MIFPSLAFAANWLYLLHELILTTSRHYHVIPTLELTMPPPVATPKKLPKGLFIDYISVSDISASHINDIPMKLSPTSSKWQAATRTNFSAAVDDPMITATTKTAWLPTGLAACIPASEFHVAKQPPEIAATQGLQPQVLDRKVGPPS